METLRRWWLQMGRQAYPSATRLLLSADRGGSNSSRRRCACRRSRTSGGRWPSRLGASVRRRPTYLAQLVHLEVTGRRERRIQRRIQDVRFPMLKTLDAFSFEAQPDLDRDAVLAVFDCRFVAEAANVVFVGGVDLASCPAFSRASTEITTPVHLRDQQDDGSAADPARCSGDSQNSAAGEAMCTWK